MGVGNDHIVYRIGLFRRDFNLRHPVRLVPYKNVGWIPMIEFALTALAWARKPPGLYVVIALAAALALWWFGQHEFSSGKTACETAHQVAITAEVQRQERAATAAVAASEARTADDTAKDQSNREIIRYVVKTVYARPDAGVECIPAAVADRLRSLQ
jgi:hypothetical protein